MASSASAYKAPGRLIAILPFVSVLPLSLSSGLRRSTPHRSQFNILRPSQDITFTKQLPHPPTPSLRTTHGSYTGGLPSQNSERPAESERSQQGLRHGPLLATDRSYVALSFTWIIPWLMALCGAITGLVVRASRWSKYGTSEELVMFAATGAKRMMSYRRAMNDAYWAFCCKLFYALYDQDHEHPDLGYSLKDGRVSGCKALLEFLQEDGVEYSYWPDDIWEAAASGEERALSRDEILQLIPDFRPLGPADLSPGYSPRDMLSAAMPIRDQPTLIYAVTFMTVTFAEEFIRRTNYTDYQGRNSDRRLAVAVINQLIDEAGYRETYPVDVMRIFVRVKYKYDFEEENPDYGEEEQEDDDIPLGEDGQPLTPEEAKKRAEEEAWKMQQEREAAEKDGYVRSKTAIDQFREHLKFKQRLNNDADDFVNNYPYYYTGAPPEPTPNFDKEEEPEEREGYPVNDSFDYASLKNMSFDPYEAVRLKEQEEEEQAKGAWVKEINAKKRAMRRVGQGMGGAKRRQNRGTSQ